MAQYEFNVLMENSFSDLPNPEETMNLTKIRLISSWLPRRERLLDVTGLNAKEVFQKILRFYKHKTFRRCIGDHIFFEGFNSDEIPCIILGS